MNNWNNKVKKRVSSCRMGRSFEKVADGNGTEFSSRREQKRNMEKARKEKKTSWRALKIKEETGVKKEAVLVLIQNNSGHVADL